MSEICSLPGCGQPINPLLPFTIKDQSGKYHSQQCASQALAGTNQKRKKVPKEPAKEFGEAGVTKQFCDNPDCHKVIIIAWKGRDGEYCSNGCLNKMEPGETTMNAAEAATAPITGEETKKPVKKAATKKTAAAKKAPAAPAKKTAPKKGSAKVDGDLFRDGSTKAKIWAKIKDGKKHARADVRAFVEKEGKTPQLITFVIAKATENGYKDLSDRETIQLEKK